MGVAVENRAVRVGSTEKWRESAKECSGEKKGPPRARPQRCRLTGMFKEQGEWQID